LDHVSRRPDLADVANLLDFNVAVRLEVALGVLIGREVD
jgi:hypothetical protein